MELTPKNAQVAPIFYAALTLERSMNTETVVLTPTLTELADMIRITSREILQVLECVPRIKESASSRSANAGAAAAVAARLGVKPEKTYFQLIADNDDTPKQVRHAPTDWYQLFASVNNCHYGVAGWLRARGPNANLAGLDSQTRLMSKKATALLLATNSLIINFRRDPGGP